MTEQQLEQWHEAMEKVMEAFREWAEAMVPVWCSFIDSLTEWWIAFKRHYLYLRLRRWLPDRVAEFLADRWPSRLLPVPDLETSDEWHHGCSAFVPEGTRRVATIDGQAIGEI